MKRQSFKIKKGGIDTIVAYIVVMLPLLYVVVYMVATIYHFSVQTYMNQVVKEATMMASTYGEITDAHKQYITNKLTDVAGECNITCYLKNFNDNTGIVDELMSYPFSDPSKVNKGDIIGIYVISKGNSILENVSAFNLFKAHDPEDPDGLKYYAYKEEIVRNDRP